MTAKKTVQKKPVAAKKAVKKVTTKPTVKAAAKKPVAKKVAKPVVKKEPKIQKVTITVHSSDTPKVVVKKSFWAKVADFFGF